MGKRRAETFKTVLLTCPKIAEISEVFPLPTLPQIPTSFPYKGKKDGTHYILHPFQNSDHF